MDSRGPFQPELLYDSILKVKLCKVMMKCCQEAGHFSYISRKQREDRTVIRYWDHHNVLKMMESLKK